MAATRKNIVTSSFAIDNAQQQLIKQIDENRDQKNALDQNLQKMLNRGGKRINSQAMHLQTAVGAHMVNEN